jgi:hypothetical protein
MRHWEYRTVALHPASVSLTRVNGWRLKEINEQEQPDWKKSEIYHPGWDTLSHVRMWRCIYVVNFKCFYKAFFCGAMDFVAMFYSPLIRCFTYSASYFS